MGHYGLVTFLDGKIMGQAEAGKFACAGCGKEYAWKESIAGKSAKCACGALIRVPVRLEKGDEDAGLYELAAEADAAAPAASSAAGAVAVPAPRAVPAAGRAVGYENPRERARREGDGFSYDKMVDPMRDLYVPVGLLVAGFVAALAWGIREVSAGAEGMVIVSLAMGVTTLVKTVVVTGLAMVFAPRLGISFGTLWTGVLKFAAILIFTDAALLWLDVVMHAAGAISSSGRAARGTFTVSLLLTAGLISFLCFYLFNMDREETGMFAVPLAIVSRVVGFVLKLVAFAVLEGMAQSAAPPAVATGPAAVTTPPAGVAVAPSGGSGVAGGTSSAPAGPVVVPTERDLEIDRRVGMEKRLVQEGREWKRTHYTKDKALGQLIEQLYVAGAEGVYVEMDRPLGGRPAVMYVRLPAGAKERAACAGAVEAFRRTRESSASDSADSGKTRQYIVVGLSTGK